MRYPSLEARLVCPDCRADLESSDHGYICEACSTRFEVRSGIPSLLPGGSAVIGVDSGMTLSVLILARNEGPNLRVLLREMKEVLKDLDIEFELLVIDGNSTDSTVETAQELGARVHVQERPGYGNAFREGLERCGGRYILTFDADGSHDPNYIRVLWRHRHRAELIVGSRYVSRGEAWMPQSRRVLSRALNIFMTKLLAIPLEDGSSGFRLYTRAALQDIELQGRDFNVLIELLVKMRLEGHRILEVPFLYKPRLEGVSKANLARFAVSYLRSAWHLFRQRNSIDAADYDSRAYNSWIWPQRYWQRRRYEIIMKMLDRQTSDILDVGCGSSKIIQSTPGMVGLDFSLRKLRYLRETNPFLIHGSIFGLPFPDQCFETVICSQVIEHIPDTEKAVTELLRVLKPGGKFILGTPDYAGWQWPLIESVYERVIPGGYAIEHITHLTRDGVVKMVENLGAEYLDEDFICKGEWVGLFRKKS